MRVTSTDLMMGNWHRLCGLSGTRWSFDCNGSFDTALTFHEAARMYKNGIRGDNVTGGIIHVLRP